MVNQGGRIRMERFEAGKFNFGILKDSVIFKQHDKKFLGSFTTLRYLLLWQQAAR